MLLQNLGLLSSDPAEFVRLLIMVAFGLTIAITLHEFSHAYVAHLLGDDTARRHGRISLNPLAHLDPMGTLLLLVAGFGWGKPVPVNSSFLRSPVRWSMAAVAVSGIVTNLLTATLIALPIRLNLFSNYALITLLAYTVEINVVLAIFNLIPLPPLDGFNLLSAALSGRVMRSLGPAIRWGPAILLGLLVVDGFFPTNIISTVIGWPVNHITSALLGLG